MRHIVTAFLRAIGWRLGTLLVVALMALAAKVFA